MRYVCSAFRHPQPATCVYTTIPVHSFFLDAFVDQLTPVMVHKDSALQFRHFCKGGGMKQVTAMGMIRAVVVAVAGVTTMAAGLSAVTFTIQAPSSSAFCGVWQGFGAEWDPWFFSGPNQQSGLTQQDWDTVITPRVQQIGVSIVRVWIQLRLSLIHI